MRSLLVALCVLCLPIIAHAQDIAHPTCQQIESMAETVGMPAHDLIAGYLIRDWQDDDSVPAPGQGPIEPILAANMTHYGPLVAAACNIDMSELFAFAANQVYLQARTQLFGRLPQ